MELPIFDCRLPIADRQGEEFTHRSFNRQSAIDNGNESVAFGLKPCG
jgi:hypothetical protein